MDKKHTSNPMLNDAPVKNNFAVKRNFKAEKQEKENNDLDNNYINIYWDEWH